MLQQTHIVKDSNFVEAPEVKVDAKKRIRLSIKTGQPQLIYKVYYNSLGQIILDPQATIPAHEQWLFKNKKAADLVKAGLEDAKKGRLVKSKEDFSKYTEQD